MALGSLAFVASDLIAPDWFEARMHALSDMPEALWWIIGGVLSLRYGSRWQDRALDPRREEATRPCPAEPASVLPDASAPLGSDAALAIDTLAPGSNPALEEWLTSRA